jgi:antitoxin MazE
MDIHYLLYLEKKTMITKVQKWGNSQGVRIPKKFLDNSHIKIGEEVELAIRDGKIIIESTNKIHGRYSISELVSNLPKDYNSKEENWGNPVGKEEW